MKLRFRHDFKLLKIGESVETFPSDKLMNPLFQDQCEAVPAFEALGNDRLPVARVGETHLGECVVLFSIIAGGARDNEVFKSVSAAVASGDDVLDVEIESLEDDVFFNVSRTSFCLSR